MDKDELIEQIERLNPFDEVDGNYKVRRKDFYELTKDNEERLNKLLPKYMKNSIYFMCFHKNKYDENKSSAEEIEYSVYKNKLRKMLEEPKLLEKVNLWYLLYDEFALANIAEDLERIAEETDRKQEAMYKDFDNEEIKKWYEIGGVEAVLDNVNIDDIYNATEEDLQKLGIDTKHKEK